jgi:hypothetical protein
VRVHLAVEHALQLEAAHLGFEPLCIGVDVASGGFVSLAFGKLEELRCVRYAFGGALDLAGVGGEARPFTSQLLRPFGFGPNGRIFQLAPYLFEALLLEIVLKETPVRSGCAPRGL